MSDDLFDLDEVVGGYQDAELLRQRNRPGLLLPRGNARYSEVGDIERPSVVHDELDQYVARMNEAAIGPNGEQVDEIYQLERLRNQAQRSLQVEAPFTRKNPRSITSTPLGAQVTVSSVDGTSFASPQVWGGDSINQGPAISGLTGTVTQFAPLVQWVGDDVETTPITVSVFPVGIGSGYSTFVRPVGLLVFGTKNMTSSVLFDIGYGRQFTVFGSAATLSVGLDGVSGKTSKTRVLGGTMSFTQGPRPIPLYRTVYLDLYTGNSTSVLVPPFAQRVFFQSADTTVAVKLKMNDANNDVCSVFDTTADSNMTPYPLPGDCQIVNITRNAGGDAQARLIFELGI